MAQLNLIPNYGTVLDNQDDQLDLIPGYGAVKQSAAAGGSPVINSLLSSFESLSFISRSFPAAFEIKAPMNAELESCIESNKSEVALRLAGFETSHGIIESQSNALESLQRLTLEEISSVEVLSNLVTSIDAPVESMSNVIQSVSTEIESKQLRNFNRQSSTESLAGLAVSETGEFEANSTAASVSRSLQGAFESLLNISQPITTIIESNSSLITISNSESVSLEALARIEQSEQAPFVVLRALNQTSAGGLECVSTIIISGQAAFESLLSVNNELMVSREALQQIRALVPVAYEVDGSGFAMKYEHLLMLLSDTDYLTTEIKDKSFIH